MPRLLASALAVVTVLSLGGAVAAQDATFEPAATERLEAAFPEQLGGWHLEVTSFSGDEIIAGAAEGDEVLELIDVVAAHGATMADFAIASGAIREQDEHFIGLLAASISGVPAADVQSDLTRLILELDEEVELTPDVIAGREVTRVGSGSGLTGEAVVYVLASDQIAWFIVAEPEDLEAIVSVLP